jgi:hypothetical protein
VELAGEIERCAAIPADDAERPLEQRLLDLKALSSAALGAFGLTTASQNLAPPSAFSDSNAVDQEGRLLRLMPIFNRNPGGKIRSQDLVDPKGIS